MSFEWDEANSTHLSRHEVSPKEAEAAILNRPLDLSTELRDGEERTVQIGETNAGRILIVVSTAHADVVRVITAWPARDRLRRYFLTQKRSGHVGRIEEEDVRE